MNKLTVTLKQHTPLIHFQHDQEGATLRASEVKPKLDKFILTKLGKDATDKQISIGKIVAEKKKEDFDKLNNHQKGYYIARGLEWLVGKEDKPALDYKLRIVNTGKHEKANINIINDEKVQILYENIELFFLSHTEEILDTIKKAVSSFFVVYNFGFRQSKGYGSFIVTKTNNDFQTFQISDYKNILSEYYYENIKYFTFDESNFEKYKPKKIIKIKKDHRNIIKENSKLKRDFHIPKDLLDRLNRISFIEEDKVLLMQKFEVWIESLINELNKIPDNDIKKYYITQIQENIEQEKSHLMFHFYDYIINSTESGIDNQTGDYKLIKSGSTRENIKPVIFDFFKNQTQWEKRFIKQEISNIPLRDRDFLELKTNHPYNLQDPEGTKYRYIRAILGLAENFEFLTNQKNKKFVVKVKSLNNSIERFQSAIIFKIIDSTVFVCFKKTEEVTPILGSEYAFNLSIKDTSPNSQQRSRNIGDLSSSIQVPSDFEIKELYEFIINYLEKKLKYD